MGKELIKLGVDIRTPPFSEKAKHEAGVLLRTLQHGHFIELPHSRPMPSIGVHCHELRIQDKDKTWRIIYRVDRDAIVMVEVFAKQTRKTPPEVIAISKQRLKRYDEVCAEDDD